MFSRTFRQSQWTVESVQVKVHENEKNARRIQIGIMRVVARSQDGNFKRTVYVIQSDYSNNEQNRRNNYSWPDFIVVIVLLIVVVKTSIFCGSQLPLRGLTSFQMVKQICVVLNVLIGYYL